MSFGRTPSMLASTSRTVLAEARLGSGQIGRVGLISRTQRVEGRSVSSTTRRAIPEIITSTQSKSSSTPSRQSNILSLPPSLPRPHGIHVATLKLHAHTPEPLERFSHFAIHTAHSLNMPVANPASLPTTRSLYTVLKSPFVHKKAQENFEKRVYKKIINVYDTSPQVVDMWLRYLNNNSVQGVGMSVKLKEFVELGAGRKEVEAVQSRFGMREEIEKQAEGLKKDLGEDGDLDQAGESKA